MPGCGWREETDGFRFFEIDFTGGDARERTTVLHESIDAVQVPDGRVPMLVHWEAGDFDIESAESPAQAGTDRRDQDERVVPVGHVDEFPDHGFAGLAVDPVRPVDDDGQVGVLPFVLDQGGDRLGVIGAEVDRPRHDPECRTEPVGKDHTRCRCSDTRATTRCGQGGCDGGCDGRPPRVGRTSNQHHMPQGG